MDDFFLHVSTTTSEKSGSKFQLEFDTPLELPGESSWEVGLRELVYVNKFLNVKPNENTILVSIPTAAGMADLSPPQRTERLVILPGNYNDAYRLVASIEKKLNSYLGSSVSGGTIVRFSLNLQSGKIDYSFPPHWEVTFQRGSLCSLVGFSDFQSYQNISLSTSFAAAAAAVATAAEDEYGGGDDDESDETSVDVSGSGSFLM